jgi:hypothetical protein
MTSTVDRTTALPAREPLSAAGGVKAGKLALSAVAIC